jgi:hypothetical protein
MEPCLEDAIRGTTVRYPANLDVQVLDLLDDLARRIAFGAVNQSDNLRFRS